MLYAGANQINAIVPMVVALRDFTRHAGGTIVRPEMLVRPSRPGVFVNDSSSSFDGAHAAALNQDGSLNASSNLRRRSFVCHDCTFCMLICLTALRSKPSITPVGEVKRNLPDSCCDWATRSN